MKVHTPCPDAVTLEGLLHDRLPAPEQSELTEHVGDCTACQQALDRLAAGPPPQELRDAERATPPADSSFWPALAGLEQQLTQTVPDGRVRAPELSLDFLAPSDDPAYLGYLDQFELLLVWIRSTGRGALLRPADNGSAEPADG